MEKPPRNQIEAIDKEEPQLTNEPWEERSGRFVYEFGPVKIVFDRSGRNTHKRAETVGLPEIMFAVADGEENVAMSQPESRGVADMKYVVECFKKVCEIEEVDTVWFGPYGEDGKADARVRLFSRFADLEPVDNGQEEPFGYILRL